jgi:hypothetical protein
MLCSMYQTPILDLEQPPPKSRLPWRAILITVCAGGAFDFVLLSEHPGWPAFNGLLFLLFFYLSIAVHEVGHLVAGKLAGMEPGGISIGGFIAVKSGANWVVRFDWRRMGGGFAKPLPPKGEFRPERFAWMVAGGPLASVLFTLISAAAWWAGGSRSEALGSMFWAGLLTAVISALPFTYASAKSDGARLLLILRHPDAARAWMALAALLAEEAAGMLPRDWDRELCALALNPPPAAPEYSYAQLLAYYRTLDLGRDEDAPALIENGLVHSAKAGKLVRYCCFLEAACASACLRKNSEQARTWLARGRKLLKPETTASLDAAIALRSATATPWSTQPLRAPFWINASSTAAWRVLPENASLLWIATAAKRWPPRLKIAPGNPAPTHNTPEQNDRRVRCYIKPCAISR